MNLPELFAQSFIVGFSGAMMPGPVFAVNVSEAPKHGWKTGPLITIGHGIAEIAVVVLLALGVASLGENPGVRRGIALLGGAGLIVMGGMMLYDTFRHKVNYDISRTGDGRHLLVIKGLTTTLSNPYWFVWWATAGLQFVSLARPHGAIGQATFYVGHILSDLTWYTVVGIVVWSGRKLLIGPGLRVLLSLCGTFLIYLGAKFIYEGLFGTL